MKKETRGRKKKTGALKIITKQESPQTEDNGNHTTNNDSRIPPTEIDEHDKQNAGSK